VQINLIFFYNLIKVLKVSIPDAILMSSENPAKFVGLNHIGTIEVGKQANLIIFDRELNLSQVILNGSITSLT